ncbi:hypothetical protein HDV00_003972 [Rhizophlyctis rosea]|nr:hypothetical protein HDV00_003972 [Rhizophlyctis rosea]
MGKGGADPSFEAAKWSTIGTTFLTMLIGGALIGLGVFGLVNPLGTAWVPNTLPILSIVIGGIVFVVSLVGFFAAVGELRTFVYIYFGVLLLLVIFQYLIGILALTNRGEVIATTLDSRWSDLYEHKPRYIRDVEEHYACCGLFNTTDRAWPKTYSINVTNEACLKHPDFGYDQPCIKPVTDEWEERQTIFGIGILVLATIQFLGLIPTYYLASRLPGTAADREAFLREEHRRLINDHPQRPGGYGGVGGVERPGSQYSEDGTLVGGRGVQHPTGGPAGAYQASSGRPGSRVM